MAVSKLPEIPFVTLEQMPECRLDEHRDVAPQIAGHLIEMLEAFGFGEHLSLKVPSPVTLAGFYKRNVLDILDALFEVKMRHYDYITNGLDEPVILHDPFKLHLCKRKQPQVKPCSCQPWGMLGQTGHCVPPIYPLTGQGINED